MTVLKIKGGTPLHGEITVGGSKNAALAILASLPVVTGKVTLTNLPDVSDIKVMLSILEGFGAVIDRQDHDLLTIDLTGIKSWVAPEAEIGRIRTGFYLLGPLLARLGEVTMPNPGGCAIGSRPVDIHEKGLKTLGADITSDGKYVATVKQFKAAEIYLDLPSAGATQHLMATATLVEGETVLQNASIEPEVVALAEFLIAMGARIEGHGTNMITVRGQSKLVGSERPYKIPADRIQAGTYLVAAAITRGDITVREILPENQVALVSKLRECGAEVFEDHDSVRVRATGRLNGVKVKTLPYPGFPTDMQQPMTALLTTCHGLSKVVDTIYEARSGHIRELERMGAVFDVEGGVVGIKGVDKLHGLAVMATDLRAGAALCLAGLVAEGETIIQNVHYIDRGYQALEETIRHLGGTIERLESNSVA